jgi:hypothetical protein
MNNKPCSRPRRFLRWELLKVGVVMVDRDNNELKCVECGRKWHAHIQKGAKIRQKHYWQCPNYCNATSERLERHFVDVSIREEFRLSREARVKTHWLFKPKSKCDRIELRLRYLFKEV